MIGVIDFVGRPLVACHWRSVQVEQAPCTDRGARHLVTLGTLRSQSVLVYRFR